MSFIFRAQNDLEQFMKGEVLTLLGLISENREKAMTAMNFCRKRILILQVNFLTIIFINP